MKLVIEMDAFLKDKVRVFGFWYVLVYIVTVCFGMFYFGWYSIEGLFPLKLYPFLFAEKMAKWISKKDNNEICPPKEVERDFKRMFFIVAIMAMICVVIYKFTGISFIWLII